MSIGKIPIYEPLEGFNLFKFQTGKPGLNPDLPQAFPCYTHMRIYYLGLKELLPQVLSRNFCEYITIKKSITHKQYFVLWKELIRKIIKVFTNQPFIYVIVSDFIRIKIQEIYPYITVYMFPINKLIFVKQSIMKIDAHKMRHTLQTEEYILLISLSRKVFYTKDKSSIYSFF